MESDRQSFVQKAAQFLLSGRYQAMLCTSVFMIVPFMAWLSSITIALVTLRKGTKEGGLLFAWVALIALAIGSYFVTLPWLILNIVSSYAMIYLSAVVLRKTMSWSIVLQSISLLVAIVVILLRWCFPDMYSGFESLMLKQVTHMGATDGGGSYSQQMLNNQFSAIQVYLNGIYAVFILLASWFNLLIARVIQAQLFNPEGLGVELRQVRCQVTFTIATVVLCLFIALIDTGLALNIALILSMSFVLSALSLLHSPVVKRLQGRSLFTVFYVVLFLFIPFSLLPVLILGVVDSAYDFRKKLARTDITTV